MKGFIIVCLSFNLMALVDYTESTPVKSIRSIEKKSTSKIRKIPSRKALRSNSLVSYLAFDLEMKTIELPSSERMKKADRYKIGAHLSTDYHLFLDLEIPYIKHRNQTSEDKEYFANPFVVLGVNWLAMSQNIPSLDILFGYSAKSKNGELAASRSSTILGFQAVKDFYIFKIALAHKIFFPSDPSSSLELSLGRIYQFQGEFAFSLASNIHFSMLGSVTTVSKGSGNNALNRSLKYKSITPKLDFALSRSHSFSISTQIPLDEEDDKSLLSKVNVFPEVGGFYRNPLIS